MGWARSQIIRPRKRLVLYKSFSSLWLEVSTPRTLSQRFLYVVFILIIQLTWREFVSFTKQPRGKFWSLHFPNRRLTSSYFVRTVFNLKRCIYSKLHKTMREVIGHHAHVNTLNATYLQNILLKAVNREDKRSRRYRDRDFAKFERSRCYRDR